MCQSKFQWRLPSCISDLVTLTFQRIIQLQNTINPFCHYNMTLAKNISMTFDALSFWKTKLESEFPIKRKIGENWRWEVIRRHWNDTDNAEQTLRTHWDGAEMTLRCHWNDAETPLKLYWDNAEAVDDYQTIIVPIK